MGEQRAGDSSRQPFLLMASQELGLAVQATTENKERFEPCEPGNAL